MTTKTLIGGIALAATFAPIASFAQSPTTATSLKAKTDFTCIQTALDKREDGISSAWTTYETAVSAALGARKTGLHDAWGLATAKQRLAARNAAWATYRTSMKSASAGLRTSRGAVWNSWGVDAKACKVPVVGESKANDQLQ